MSTSAKTREMDLPFVIKTETAATIGGIGAVLGAFKGVLAGRTFTGILVAAAVAGVACAVVGAFVSLRCHQASGGEADNVTAPP